MTPTAMAPTGMTPTAMTTAAARRALAVLTRKPRPTTPPTPLRSVSAGSTQRHTMGVGVAAPRHGLVLARVVLTLGISASIAANILAAQPSLSGRVIAAWPPAALLLAVELMTRIPVSTPWRTIGRISATTAVAAIAAWVSYGHMREVAAAHGESATSAALLPLSVDGLIIVASICLMDLAHTTTAADSEPTAVAVAPEHASPTMTAPTNSPARVVTRPARAGDPHPHTTALAQRISQLRTEHPDWTQKELATAAGCTVRTIRRHTTVTPPPARAAAPVPAVPAPAVVSVAARSGQFVPVSS